MDDKEMRAEVMKLTDRTLTHDDQIHALTICMIEMDEERFDKVLSTNILKLGFEQTMMNIVYPFMSKIGVLWQTGAINPAHEHFISNLVRQKLIVAIDGQVVSGDGKKFLLFLPEGELHEISLLFASFLIKSKGHKVIYLGQNTPYDDLITVYNIHRPDYMMTVITTSPTSENAQEYLNLLAKNFSKTQILVTGYQVIGQDLVLPPNVMLMTLIRDIKVLLDELTLVPDEK
jgi:methanogenic corrinoid protein MtbC1